MFTLDSNAAGAGFKRRRRRASLDATAHLTHSRRVSTVRQCGCRSGREPSSSAARIWSAFSKTQSEGPFAKADRQDLQDDPTHGFASGRKRPTHLRRLNVTAGCVENRGAFRENAMRGPAAGLRDGWRPNGVFRPLRERRRHHPLPPECVWFQTSSRGSGRLT
jgi:hypothetical protein